MPPVSQAQRGLMHAAADGKKWATRKVDPAVAREFVAADHGGRLPEHTSRAEKARKRYPHQAKD